MTSDNRITDEKLSDFRQGLALFFSSLYDIRHISKDKTVFQLIKQVNLGKRF